METVKLFYEDPLTKEFTARVLSCRETPKGYEILLDRTAFYPGGGGQPCDTGFLGELAVTEVYEKEGEILHLCQSPLEGTVTGRLHWDRRLDFMQQHTGEHILSGLLHKKYGAENTGFHIGALVVTVDFSTPVPAEDIPELEALANQAVFENVAVVTGYPDPEVLDSLPYRSKKALTPPVRIVEVPGYDICACCGIHCATAGQVGLIKILSVEKFHQGVRMEMVCGQRALSCFRQVWEQNRKICHTFSAKPLETALAAEKTWQALEQAKFDCTQLRKKWFESLAASAKGLGDVLCVTEEMSVGETRTLAECIARHCGGTAAVMAGGNFSLFLPGGDVSSLGKELLGACAGRGGGRGEAFQGTLQADGTEFLLSKGFCKL